MLLRDKDRKFNRVLEGLTQELDLTSSQIKEAKERYRAVGQWLEKDNSAIKSFNPDIYPQGSFRLGTMIKPIKKDEYYDLDIVCSLQNQPKKISQESLKKMIGTRLKENGDYERMLQPEGRYCWTLKYAEGTRFQMDIIPSIPDSIRKQLYEKVLDENLYRHAIRITDKENENYHSIDSSTWPKSNPIGYAEWFKKQMDISFKKQKQLIAESKKVSVDDIEDFEVKTPLQRSVQILKRHRDIMFGDDDEKPISIILTTLAAKAYSNESNILEALLNIIKGIPAHIEERWDELHNKKIKWIPNPVNPKEENFADKWADKPILEDKFFDWYKKIRADLFHLHEEGLKKSFELFKDSFGQNLTINSYKKADVKIPQKKTSSLKLRDSESLFNVRHRESPRWPLEIKEKVNISARYKGKTSNGWHRYSPEKTIPTGCDIIFSASTSISKPYNVYWQVVNTGEDARKANGLRGNIFPSTTAGVGGLKQKESTLYKGVHWIECFIVKNGKCKARSTEFLVRIR